MIFHGNQIWFFILIEILSQSPNHFKMYAEYGSDTAVLVENFQNDLVIEQ